MTDVAVDLVAGGIEDSIDFGGVASRIDFGGFTEPALTEPALDSADVDDVAVGGKLESSSSSLSIMARKEPMTPRLANREGGEWEKDVSGDGWGR